MHTRGLTFIANLIVFLALETLAACLLISESNLRRLWLATSFDSAKAVIWRPIDKIRNYSNLGHENKRLFEDNLRLERTLMKERSSLRSDVSKWTMSTGTEYCTIPADIVTMTSGSQHNYIIVDRGEDDNVEVNDGIVTSKGVVGVVTRVGRRYSYAMSYENQQMAISVRTGENGYVGSLNWNGIRSDESLLSGIPLHADIRDNDIIYTSGYSSIFPPDIPLGTVIGRTDDESAAIFRIRLFEDFAKIRHVFIVKNTGREEINGLKNDQ